MSLETEKKNETAETMHKVGKVKLADALRGMCDNQTTLDMCNKSDRKKRDLDSRVTEAMAKEKYEDLSDSDPDSDSKSDDMKINIDSPTTVNHIYPEPEKVPEKPTYIEPTPIESKKENSFMTKLAPLALAAIIGAGGYGMMLPLLSGMFNKEIPVVEKEVQPVVEFEDNNDNTGFIMSLPQ